MRADNTRHLIRAARLRSDQTRERAVDSLRRLDRAGTPLTVEAVAREANVSRSWLYTQIDLRLEIERARGRQQRQVSAPLPPPRQRASDASLLRRLEAATDRIRRLEHDNAQLRQALTQSLGAQRTADIVGSPAATRDTPNNNKPKLIRRG